MSLFQNNSEMKIKNYFDKLLSLIEHDPLMNVVINMKLNLRCKPFISNIRVKLLLAFFSPNFSDTF